MKRQSVLFWYSFNFIQSFLIKMQHEILGKILFCFLLCNQLNITHKNLNLYLIQLPSISISNRVSKYHDSQLVLNLCHFDDLFLQFWYSSSFSQFFRKMVLQKYSSTFTWFNNFSWIPSLQLLLSKMLYLAEQYS